MGNNLFTYLVGSKICSISRICNLVSIQFDSKQYGEISIHIQCFFRFLRDKKIIVSSDDMCRCGDHCDDANFEWDIPGKSIYDESLEKHRDILENSKVTEVVQNAVGDMLIAFENGISLQIFIDTTESEEKYRIFSDATSIVFDS